jgi:protein TonB
LVAIILVLSIGGVFGKFLWDLNSLFGFFQKGGMAGDLELTSLVAPVPVVEDEPPPVEEKQPEKVTKVEQNVDVRKEIIQNMFESPKEVTEVKVTKNETQARRENVKTVVGDVNSNAANPVTRDSDTVAVTQTQGVGDQTGTKLSDEKEDEPQIVKPTPTPKPVPKTVSGGVVNGKARSLVTPQYPSAARAVRASGQVSVAVTIDENGNVISANAVSGHTLLRSAAESAARASKFNPTLLSGQPVKVTGTIIYNFVP